MTKSLTPQQAKQPAVAIQTKATRRTTQCGGSPGVVYETMCAPPSVSAMGNAPTTFDPPGKSDFNSKGVVAVQCQTASFPPAGANAGPHDASTVNKASIDRSPVVTATKVGHGPQLLNFTATGTAAVVRRRWCHAAMRG